MSIVHLYVFKTLNVLLSKFFFAFFLWEKFSNWFIGVCNWFQRKIFIFCGKHQAHDMNHNKSTASHPNSFDAHNLSPTFVVVSYHLFLFYFLFQNTYTNIILINYCCFITLIYLINIRYNIFNLIIKAKIFRI